MEVLAVLALLGAIPGAIAQHKGRGFFGFWVYGALLFPVALIHALVMKPDVAGVEARQLAGGAHRKCPFCAEVIKAEARVCRFCGRDLPPPEPVVATTGAGPSVHRGVRVGSAPEVVLGYAQWRADAGRWAIGGRGGPEQFVEAEPREPSAASALAAARRVWSGAARVEREGTDRFTVYGG